MMMKWVFIINKNEGLTNLSLWRLRACVLWFRCALHAFAPHRTARWIRTTDTVWRYETLGDIDWLNLSKSNPSGALLSNCVDWKWWVRTVRKQWDSWGGCLQARSTACRLDSESYRLEHSRFCHFSRSKADSLICQRWRRRSNNRWSRRSQRRLQMPKILVNTSVERWWSVA